MVGRRPSAQTVAVLEQLAQHTTGWTYGYDLCRALDIKAGTMYPILIRLAERGLMDTAWEQDAPPGRPPRHLYRLSIRGRAFIAELRADGEAANANDEPAAHSTAPPLWA
jgi:PadR family transcriptional regulator, regulatory protein PadR